jgi:hypothetical protein
MDLKLLTRGQQLSLSPAKFFASIESTPYE